MSITGLRSRIRRAEQGAIRPKAIGKTGINGVNEKHECDLDPVLADRLPQQVWEVFDPEELLGSGEPEYGDFWLDPGEEEP